MISPTATGRAVDWLVAGHSRSQPDRVVVTAAWHAATDTRYDIAMQGQLLWWAAGAAILGALVAVVALMLARGQVSVQ